MAAALSGSVTSASLVSEHPECFAGGPATATAQASATTVQQANANVTSRVARLFATGNPGLRAAAGLSGLAAGDGSDSNVWGNLGNNTTHQAYTNTGGTTSRNNADTLNGVVGVDYKLSPSLVGGVSLALDQSSGYGGTDIARNNISIRGMTLAPYLGWQLNPEWTLDVSAGVGTGKATLGDTSSTSTRWFTAGNLSYTRWLQDVQLTGRLGLLHAQERHGDITTSSGTTVAGTASQNRLTQLNLGVQAGYWMNGFMPYVGLSYLSDLDRHSTLVGADSVDPIGKNALVLSLGVNVFSLAKGISGGLAYQQESGRTHQNTSRLVASFNIRF